MTNSQAHEILNAARDGKNIHPHLILKALEETGDFTPQVESRIAQETVTEKEA